MKKGTTLPKVWILGESENVVELRPVVRTTTTEPKLKVERLAKECGLVYRDGRVGTAEDFFR